jgi:hypothetical protein
MRIFNSMEQRGTELIHLSNSENGMAELRLDFIRGEEGSKERNLQQLLDASPAEMIDAILRHEYPPAA